MTVSLRTKLILLVLAAIAGAVIVSTAMFVVRESTQHARATQERLTATANVFASTVSKSLETGDRARVLRTLRAIAKIPGVTFAEVHDANGHRFAEIGNGVGIARSTTVLQGNQQSIGDTIFSRFIEVHVDIVSAGRVIGTLTLLADNSELRARLRNGLMNTLIGAAVAIFVGTAIALWLQRSIIGPISQALLCRGKIACILGAVAEAR